MSSLLDIFLQQTVHCTCSLLNLLFFPVCHSVTATNVCKYVMSGNITWITPLSVKQLSHFLFRLQVMRVGSSLGSLTETETDSDRQSYRAVHTKRELLKTQEETTEQPILSLHWGRIWPGWMSQRSFTVFRSLDTCTPRNLYNLLSDFRFGTRMFSSSPTRSQVTTDGN